MSQTFDIVMLHGEHRMDSRVFGKHLGYDHRTVTRTIQRHQKRLQTKSSLHHVGEQYSTHAPLGE